MKKVQSLFSRQPDKKKAKPPSHQVPLSRTNPQSQGNNSFTPTPAPSSDAIPSGAATPAHGYTNIPVITHTPPEGNNSSVPAHVPISTYVVPPSLPGAPHVPVNMPSRMDPQHENNRRTPTRSPDPMNRANTFLGPSNFHEAHDFTMNNPIFNESSDQAIHVMQDLTRYTISGAEFDSSARDPPPRCHPNTRTTYFDKIQGWFHNREREKRLLWLCGPAGVGKSAILQSIAEDKRQPVIRLATLFFSRPNQRNDPTKVIPSIAYQIAVRIPLYRAHLVERLSLDPQLPQKNMSEQFRAFITEPIAQQGLLGEETSFFILLDALDECAGKEVPSASEGTHLSNEETQTTIIRLVADMVIEYPDLPLIWIISSRPEEHLKVAFSDPAIEPSFWELHVPIDDKEAREDVQRYLRDGFKDIQKRFPHSTPHNWPTKGDFKKITDAASGLFVFASTLLLFTGDPNIRNPVTQLKIILSVIDGSFVALEKNPFAILDALYSRILSIIDSSVVPNMHKLLGHLLLREKFFASDLSMFGYSLYSLANILELQQHNVYSALGRLHSVLYIPHPEVAHKENIRFLHASFSDYLKDKGRSGKRAIDLPDVNTHIWTCYSRIIRQVNNDLNPSLRMAPQLAITLSWPLNGSKFEKQMFASGLLHEAQYHWAHFLIPDCPCSGLPSSGPLGTVNLTDQQRLDTLQAVNFKELITGYFVEGSDHIGPFFTALGNFWQSSREELEKRGLITETILQNFSTADIDAETLITMDQAICVEKITEIKRDTFTIVHSWRIREMLMDELVDEVKSLQNDSPQTSVLICGGAVTKKGALVVHQKEKNVITYYYLPLR